MDFNYTFSKSMDDGSPLQTDYVNLSPGFIFNPFRQQDMYAPSDFDMRHIINANAIWRLPIGRGQPLLGNIGKVANQFLGGWQLTGIFRWNTGIPIYAPFDAAYSNNQSQSSYATRTRDVQTCPTRGGTAPPKLFGCNTT